MTRIGEIDARTKRLGEIVGVFARYGLVEPLREHVPEPLRRHLVDPDGSVATRSAPERLRLALQELGPTFVKLGQMLSVTLGTVPAAYADELAKLQERVDPEPTVVARAAIERELGRPVDELYASFGEEPLAAASIAQVYRAGLADGSALAVKVQRDGIEQHVLTDLELISYLAGLLEDHSAELRVYRPRALAARFRSRMLEELDFEREASNAQRFAENFSGEPDVVFPRIYPELSTSRVLTMSLIEGTTFASMTPDELTAVDGKALGERGAEIWLEMVFRDGFVHADPHPGNLVVLPGSRLGIIDPRPHRGRARASVVVSAEDRDAPAAGGRARGHLAAARCRLSPHAAARGQLAEAAPGALDARGDRAATRFLRQGLAPAQARGSRHTRHRRRAASQRQSRAPHHAHGARPGRESARAGTHCGRASHRLGDPLASTSRSRGRRRPDPRGSRARSLGSDRRPAPVPDPPLRRRLIAGAAREA